VEDWVEWHRAYDDPSTSLARRLVVVRRRIAGALGALGDGAHPAQRLRILSLCAGDGRDLLPVLALWAGNRRPSGAGPDTVIVEKDAVLAARAAERARAHGLDGVRTIVGDAGDPAVFADAVPADLLLLCGIFGNVAVRDIEATVDAVPALLAPGGYVVWTCGASEPDRRPAVRRLFVDNGMDEVSFDGEPENFGVGVAHLAHVAHLSGEPPSRRPVPERLFTFLR
jgi:hypothetical protein